LLLERPPTEVSESLDRILASKLFVRSTQLQRFLRYVVEQEIAGRGEEVTEAVLANEVFNRTLERHQGTSIVRTEANRLRRKLAEYYEGPGRDDAVRIVIEPGAYRPRFERSETPAEPVDAAGVRVLVWPLVPASEEPEAELLAGAVTESLTRTLDQFHGLDAIGEMSSMLAAKTGDADAAAAMLKANRVVSGDIRMERGGVAVHARMTDRDGRVLWEGRASRPIAAARDAGAELAREAAAALAPGARAEASWVQSEAVRPEALLLVERGYALSRRRTARYLEEALRYFNAALALEEDRYARAWAARAETLALYDMQSKERLAKMAEAKHAARKAVDLDPSLWEAHAVLGCVAWMLDWDLRRMEAAFQECLRLDRRRTEGYFYYWFLLAAQGRMDEALHQAQAACVNDPLNFLGLGHLAYLQILDARFEEARRTARQAKSLMPAFYLADIYLAFAAAGLGDWQGVYDHASRADALADGSTNTIGTMGFGAAKLGRIREARALLDQAIGQEEPYHQIASILFGLDEPESACEWLEKGVERQETILLHLRRIPLIAGYGDYPRLARLLDRIDKILSALQ